MRSALRFQLFKEEWALGISLGNLAGNVALNGGMGVISTDHPGYRAADFEKNPLEANKRELANEIKKAKRDCKR